MLTRRSLFLWAWAVTALLTKTDTDSAHVMSRLGTVESIVERRTYQLDDSIFISTIDKVQKDGHFYSHQPPLLSTLETPVYWLLRMPGTRFNNSGRFVMIYAFTWLTNGLALALTVLVMSRWLAGTGLDGGMNLVLSVLLVFGTWLLPYGLVTNNHGIAGLLLAVFLSLLFKIDTRGPSPNLLAASGLVLGLLAAIEWLPLVSFVPAMLLYLALRGDLSRREWMPFAWTLALPLAMHAVINVLTIGDVIPAGFHTELFHYDGAAFDDSALSGTLKYATIGAAGTYAWQALFSVKGFFVFAPICLLGIVVGCSWRWWTRTARGFYYVLITGTLASLGAALLTTNQFGGEAVGFRHATYLCPAFVMLLLPWITIAPSWRRSVVIGVAAISTASMLLFAVPQPWSVMTLGQARVAYWNAYLPILDKIYTGTLFKP